MTVSCAPRARTWARAAAACLLAVLAACRSVPLEGARIDDAPLSVVTLNLWHDRNDWPYRQRMIADALQSLAPDVILLQEVLQDAALPNQAEALAQRLGYHWYFVSVDAPGRTRRYGNAILTREPTTQRDSRALQPLDDYRIAGHVRTTVRGHAVDAYVVHLNFTDRSGATRARQVRDLMAFVQATSGRGAVVIGGDFNTTAATAEMAPLGPDFIDAYAAAHEGVDIEDVDHATLNARFNPSARIDRIYARRDAFCRPQARRILDRPDAGGAWASDHFGVWVRLPWAASGRCGARGNEGDAAAQ